MEDAFTKVEDSDSVGEYTAEEESDQEEGDRLCSMKNDKTTDRSSFVGPLPAFSTFKSLTPEASKPKDSRNLRKESGVSDGRLAYGGKVWTKLE